MKVNQSRKSTHSIMAHSGFGMLTITRGSVEVHVPESWLFNDGTIKKYAIKSIDRMFEKARLHNESEISHNESVI